MLIQKAMKDLTPIERHNAERFCMGLGIAISNLWSITHDSNLCRQVAGGVPFTDFIGLGMGRWDINNIRAALKERKPKKYVSCRKRDIDSAKRALRKKRK